MMILLSIVLIILFFLLRKYKETIVVLAVVSQHLAMFYFPFSSMKMFGPIAILAISLLPFKVHRKKIFGSKYPFKWMTIVLFISYILPNFSRSNIPSTVGTFVTTYAYLIVLWICLDSPGRVRLFVKTLTVLLIFHVLYGIYEVVLLSNPIMDYFWSKHMILINPSHGLRYGLKRIQSFSPYIGACGMVSGMGFIVLLFLKMHFDKFFLLGNRIYLLLVGLFICVFLTGTRSVFAGFAVGLLAFFNLKYFDRKSVVMSILLFILISPLLYNYLSEYTGKIIHTFLETKSAAGSNIDMREVQMNITLNYWKKSPVIGNGIGFTSGLIGLTGIKDLYGAESVWFLLLMDMGIVGCASFILTMFCPIFTLIKTGLSPIIFLVFLFLLQKTLSSVPGISLGFHLIFVIFFLRLKEFADRGLLDATRNMCKN